jgi:hypothetical protein
MAACSPKHSAYPTLDTQGVIAYKKPKAATFFNPLINNSASEATGRYCSVEVSHQSTHEKIYKAGLTQSEI